MRTTILISYPPREQDIKSAGDLHKAPSSISTEQSFVPQDKATTAGGGDGTVRFELYPGTTREGTTLYSENASLNGGDTAETHNGSDPDPRAPSLLPPPYPGRLSTAATTATTARRAARRSPRSRSITTIPSSQPAREVLVSRSRDLGHDHYEEILRRRSPLIEALQSSLGYTAEELQRLTLYDIVDHDGESSDRDAERALTEGHSFLGERRYRRRDGSLIEVEVNVSIITYGGRQTMSIVAHDVTERKRAEQRLQHTLDRLLALYEASQTLPSTGR